MVLEKEKAAGLAADDLKGIYMSEYSGARSAIQSPSSTSLADLLAPESGNLEVAVNLVQRGFAVFPVRNWTDGDGWKPIGGFPEKASTDANCIRAWWAKWPEARVALLTGERNGITVLDVDIKNGKDGAASLAKLGFSDLAAMTPVRTRSPSGGWHLFFAHDPSVKGTVGTIGPGLDVRNRNQFVLAPDSLKDGKRYRVEGHPLGSAKLPPFPAALMQPPAPERAPVAVQLTATDHQRHWAANLLAKKAAALAVTPEGSRNATLNGAAMWAGGAAAHGMLTEEQASEALVSAAVEAGYSDREAKRAFRHGWKDGLGKPIDGFPQDWADDDFEEMPPRSATDLSDLLGTNHPTVEMPEDARAAKIGTIRAKNGDLKPTLHNAILVLRTVNRDRAFNLRKNDMTGQDEWRGGQLQDADLGMIRVAVEQAGMHNVGADLTAEAVRAVAKSNRFHPVQEWLASLQHDGTPRLDTWLSRYIGADDNAYTRAVGRAFLVAMVARVMAPGCKHDHVLVLGGEQGIGKSTACSILGGEWFGDNMPSIRDGAKEAGLYLRGHWLVELAELAPSRKAEAEDLKAFLTRSTDEIRAPYARKADAVLRQCVFVGTTNETAFLRDVTGGRRFWPVTCGAINTDALARDRAELFAEALAAFKAGERWHLDQETEQLAQLEQEAAREEDSWESAIADHLAGDGEFNDPVQSTSARDLLSKIGVPIAGQTQSQMQRVARILKRMGWEREHNRNGKVWVRK